MQRFHCDGTHIHCNIFIKHNNIETVDNQLSEYVCKYCVGLSNNTRDLCQLIIIENIQMDYWYNTLFDACMSCVSKIASKQIWLWFCAFSHMKSRLYSRGGIKRTIWFMIIFHSCGICDARSVFGNNGKYLVNKPSIGCISLTYSKWMWSKLERPQITAWVRWKPQLRVWIQSMFELGTTIPRTTFIVNQSLPIGITLR